jgi:hypothetical protein
VLQLFLEGVDLLPQARDEIPIHRFFIAAHLL